ncbi:hypothetical protein VTL71DRAFT_13178 [Oculimacula yallundae]|uniref:Uncharacterized protein n=1 Tax=Oculimacula yallundae TaxID=86028 RepID=A0ABR4CK90_9HELO
MHGSVFFSALVTGVVLVPLVSALSFTFFQTTACKTGGETLRDIVYGPGAGCQIEPVTNGAGSVSIRSTGPIDNTFYAAFFSSNDCNPDTIVVHGDENNGCLNSQPATWGSMQVYNVCEDEGINCLD